MHLVMHQYSFNTWTTTLSLVSLRVADTTVEWGPKFRVRELDYAVDPGPYNGPDWAIDSCGSRKIKFGTDEGGSIQVDYAKIVARAPQCSDSTLEILMSYVKEPKTMRRESVRLATVSCANGSKRL